MKRASVPLIAQVLVLTLVYFATAKLGLSLAALHSNVTPVWPPTGISIAALLLFGRRLWPGVFLGALAANFLTDIPAGSALGIAVGNTLEAIVAVWLLYRVARWGDSLDSVGDVMRFVGCAAVLAPMVSATIGSSSLCLKARLWAMGAGEPERRLDFADYVCRDEYVDDTGCVGGNERAAQSGG